MIMMLFFNINNLYPDQYNLHTFVISRYYICIMVISRIQVIARGCIYIYNELLIMNEWFDVDLFWFAEHIKCVIGEIQLGFLVLIFGCGMDFQLFSLLVSWFWWLFLHSCSCGVTPISCFFFFSFFFFQDLLKVMILFNFIYIWVVGNWGFWKPWSA